MAEETPPDNVTPIRGRQKKEQQSIADYYHSLAKIIDGFEFEKDAAFSKFYAAAETDGPVTPLRQIEYDGTVEATRREDVAAELQRLSVTLERVLTWRQALDAADYWLHFKQPLVMPPPFLWPEDESFLTFRRLPWAKGSDASETACPTWRKVLGRMGNHSAFIRWIGSLFDPASDKQQYVWLYGVGGEGKSAMCRVLQQVFGNAAASKQPPAPGDRFWYSCLVNRRLIIFPDCNSKTFVSSGAFKSLSGDDEIPIEQKFKNTYSYRHNCKFIFLSNEMPTISSERADKRRIILCSMSPREDNDVYDANFEARLWAEAGTFLSNCIELYKQDHPNHGPIACVTDELDSWIEVVEEDYEAVVERHFVITPFKGHKADGSFIPASDFYRAVSQIFPRRGDRLEFVSWLRKKHKVSKYQVRCGEARGQKRYVGIQMRVENGNQGTNSGHQNAPDVDKYKKSE